MQDIFSVGSGGGLNPVAIAINVILSFLLGYFIAQLYKATHKGLSYSQAFTQTLVILPIISTAAMMVIGSNLARAFGLAGALSIIRFRTVVKDPKDIGYVFWSLVIGMACGTQGYMVAIIATVLLSLVILILFKLNFGSIRKHDYILRYNLNTQIAENDEIYGVLETYFKSCVLLTMNAHEAGNVLEFSYNVHFINEAEQYNLLKELSAFKGVSNVYLLKASSDVDY